MKNELIKSLQNCNINISLRKRKCKNKLIKIKAAIITSFKANYKKVRIEFKNLKQLCKIWQFRILKIKNLGFILIKKLEKI